MPRLVQPIAFHPSLQFRYFLWTSKIPGAAIHARSAQQPAFDNNPIFLEHKNAYFKVKGKTRWNDITLMCYMFEGITARELWKYQNRDHQNVDEASDFFSEDYKHMMQLFIVNPMGIPVNRWKLHGAFISAASWGDLDWASDEVIQCQITISYDWAELSQDLGEFISEEFNINFNNFSIFGN